MLDKVSMILMLGSLGWYLAGCKDDAIVLTLWSIVMHLWDREVNK